MIKIIFLLTTGITFALSSQVTISTKIVGKIIFALNSDAKIWLNKETNYIDTINTNKLNIVNYCKDANIVIINSRKRIPINCKGLPVITFEYSLLKDNKNAVASFFWKRGRPNIVFVKDRLNNFNIKIPLKYNSYLIDSI